MTSTTPTVFTFHNVSINSKLCWNLTLIIKNLHSIMDLLILFYLQTGTFINGNLHSIMDLLIRKTIIIFLFVFFNLHSIMYLLIRNGDDRTVPEVLHLHSIMDYYVKDEITRTKNIKIPMVCRRWHEWLHRQPKSPLSTRGSHVMMSVHFGIKGVYCNAPTNL